MKDQIFKFLKEQVIGKILHTDKTIYQLENKTLEGEYQDEMLFSDLVLTENGLRFNMTIVTKENLYRLDGNLKRVEIVKDYTGTSVFQYELAVRKSTSQITGFMHCISSSVKEQNMDAVVYGVYDIKLENEQLKWKEIQLLYRDSPTGDNSFCPAAFDSTIRFHFENDKLIFEYLPTFCDVNPITLEKTPSKDKYPPYITREI